MVLILAYYGEMPGVSPVLLYAVKLFMCLRGGGKPPANDKSGYGIYLIDNSSCFLKGANVDAQNFI
jgi:hypothetical protein